MWGKKTCVFVNVHELTSDSLCFIFTIKLQWFEYFCHSTGKTVDRAVLIPQLNPVSSGSNALKLLAKMDDYQELRSAFQETEAEEVGQSVLVLSLFFRVCWYRRSALKHTIQLFQCTQITPRLWNVNTDSSPGPDWSHKADFQRTRLASRRTTPSTSASLEILGDGGDTQVNTNSSNWASTEGWITTPQMKLWR